MDRVTASFFMSLLLVGGGRRARRRMRDGLVDAEPQNVREIISVQAVCLIFRGQSEWGFLLPPAVRLVIFGLFG